MGAISQTLILGSDSNIGSFRGGSVLRITDIFVCSATGNPTKCMFYNATTNTDAAEMITIGVDSVTTTNATASATNYFSFSDGIRFDRGCYFTTTSNFRYASVTFNQDMS